MNRVVVLIDIANTYYTLSKTYDGKKLDYMKLLHFISSQKGEIFKSIAYGMQKTNEATKFIQRLNSLGIETKFKEVKSKFAKWTVGLAMDLVRLAENTTTVVIVSNDPDLIPVMNWAVEKGIEVVVCAPNVGKSVFSAATQHLIITDDLLEEQEAKE